jgi:hypothetical protein
MKVWVCSGGEGNGRSGVKVFMSSLLYLCIVGPRCLVLAHALNCLDLHIRQMCSAMLRCVGNAVSHFTR